MELNEILNGLNGCGENKGDQCGCNRGFGNNWIWILILLFLFCGFGNNNNVAVDPLFVETKKTKKKFTCCKTSFYSPINENPCCQPMGYGMNQGLGGFCGYGGMWWFIILIILFCGFGSFGRGIGCNDVCVTK